MAEDSEPYRIAMVGPLTGPGTQYGQAYKNTMEILRDKTNAEGGIGLLKLYKSSLWVLQWNCNATAHSTPDAKHVVPAILLGLPAQAINTGGFMPAFLQVIKDKRKGFTRSYRFLADYIENHTVEIAFMSIQELSNKTHVSTATIHRFCLEIGLNGYSDFQREVQNEIRERYNIESSQEVPNEEARSILAYQVMQNIRVLQEMLSESEELEKAIDESAELLINARRIFVLGFEGDYASAYSTYSDFLKIFDNVTQLSMDSGNYLSTIRTIKPDDVLYIISFNVYNRHILEIVNTFLRARANIVTLADDTSPFNAFANVAMIPKHNTPSYGSVMKVTIQRALMMTIRRKLNEDSDRG